MDSSNARKDGKCLRYKRDWRETKFTASDFIQFLTDRVQQILIDVEDDFQPDACIIGADSRSQRPAWGFDYCITSPPYLNSFDYTDVYRPELFLGGYVRSMLELSQLRMSTVRSHVQVKWEAPMSRDFGATYEHIDKELRKDGSHYWNKRIPQMVQAYFEDIRSVLAHLRYRANTGAKVWLVVSRSAYGGLEIPVDTIISEIAERIGWRVRQVRLLRRLERIASQNRQKGESTRWLQESAVILDL